MIGTTLGHRYELVRLIGRGGMGSVYEAERNDTRERVAVKVLHSHLLEPSGDGPRRFRREAEAARAIRGDHVARVIDAGTDDASGQLYLVTERLDGEDLQSLLDRTGPLAPDAALRIAAQALLGLSAAHAASVVHRDIKPANIFLARAPDGSVTVKLLDFGIAKVRLDPLAASQAGLTTTGGFLGSPLFMSPEQVQSSRDVDHRADLWSLASVLYAAIAGRAPHEHLEAVGRILVAICVSPPPRLTDVAPWSPPAIADIVHTALSIDPAGRFPSAAAMLAAIRPLVSSLDLTEASLAPAGERARDVPVSSMPPSPALATPRVVVVSGGAASIGEGSSDRAIHAAFAGSDTLPSGPVQASSIERSAVPTTGVRAGARVVTVDPRRLLGETSEIWTLSLDVHRHASSLVARIWRSLRRAGAKLPPMSYGATWALYEPRTGRTIAEPRDDDTERTSLEQAGIRPGIVLWVVPVDAETGER